MGAITSAPFSSSEGMTQATTKLHLKPGTFEAVNAILVDELEAMKEFDGLYDLAVVKVDELTLMINATYFSTALLDSNLGHDTVMSDSLQAGLSKLGEYLAKPPERTIGEVLMTKSTCPKPDNSQWAEPGEF